ncbi:hypothetical protein Sjap_011251 [Stephania japonica]|uniref:Uncharacterized protein n=1 Tax=Stephania japonica TaxID=461633 RepID=A0AAP0P5D5_9MAGN
MQEVRSSKKAEKRAKLTKKALYDTLERSQNIGITINDCSYSSSFNRAGQDEKRKKGKKVMTNLPRKEVAAHDTLDIGNSNSSDSSNCEEDGEMNPSSPIKEPSKMVKRKEKTSSSQKEKKGIRGPTRLAMIAVNAPRLTLTFNDKGQEIGKSSNKFASYIGVIVREHVPVTIKDWHKVDSITKEAL